MLAGSVGRVGTSSNHSLEVLTNNTAAITIDTSQNATFAGNITASGKVVTTEVESSGAMLLDAANMIS